MTKQLGNPDGWTNRFINWCLGILLAAAALYCAVRLLEAIWPTLIVIVGCVAILALIIRAAVYFTSRNSW